MSDEFVSAAKVKMDKTIEVFKKDLGQIRTGKANPGIFDDLRIEYYGAMTPMNQLCNITVPEARVMIINPFDKSAMKSIEKAILTSGLGLTPNNDGSVLRITLPELTGDRRKELVKIVKHKSEEKKVAIRNIRRDIMDDIKKSNADSSQDMIKGMTDKIQKVTDEYIAKIVVITEEKEKEIMKV